MGEIDEKIRARIRNLGNNGPISRCWDSVVIEIQLTAYMGRFRDIVEDIAHCSLGSNGRRQC